MALQKGEVVEGRIFAFAELDPNPVEAGSTLLHTVSVGAIELDDDELMGLECRITALPPHRAWLQGTVPDASDEPPTKFVLFTKPLTWVPNRGPESRFSGTTRVAETVIVTAADAANTRAEVKTVFSDGRKDLQKLDDAFDIV